MTRRPLTERQWGAILIIAAFVIGTVTDLVGHHGSFWADMAFFAAGYGMALRYRQPGRL